MRLTGYSDRWSAAPGEAVTFYVSCLQPRYRAQLLRLIHGDNNPRGPGVKEVAIDHPVNGSYPGSGQPIFTGSYLVTDGACRFGGGGGLTLQTWIRPTLSHQDSQGIIGQWDAANHRGFLLLVRQGGIEAWIGVQGGEPLRLRIERPLHKLEWQFVSLVVDLAGRRATLRHDLSAFDPRHSASATVDGVASGPIALADDCRITIGAGWLVSHGERVAPQACFNGRIEGPRLWGAALPPDAVEQLKTGASPAEAAKFLLAAWDFSHDPGGTRIPDRVDGRLDARSVNRPMRATSSHTWNPTIERFTDAPAAYNAIWFHEDDLADACWAPSFTLRVPESLPSGVYAVKIEGEDGARDYLPFIVRPPHGRATAPLAVLLPTVSYMAYANEALLELQQLTGMVTHANKWLHVEEYAYLNRHHLRSLYDHHRDGSGICYSSILRPVLTSFRPYHRCRSFDAPHQLSADLWLVDWLVQKGIPFDVITDHDLHREGVELLGRYRTVISGTHAEYTTTPMLDALHAYQRQGGRFICLSGNGFYWVTALDAQGQTVCEIRRANGSRTWAPEPGEN
ncbi:MAG: N,N-dimethylformamidase beta subunit family domain-containing protein, partial [Dehalococcoidia bacterium]